MKKTIILTALLFLNYTAIMAQGKVKVMIQQIADLATSLKTLKDGYKTVDKGLTNIHGLKNGSFDLNQGYFNSLKQVSPAVKNNPKLTVIAADQQRIVALFQNELSWQKNLAVLDDSEISYFQNVNANILTLCSRDLEELKLATEAGTQMSDEERINRIDKVYLATEDKLQFTQSFINKSHQLAISRQDDKIQNKTVRKLYDLN
jgi:hypothetical protein